MDIKVLNRYNIERYHCDINHIVISINESGEFAVLPEQSHRKGLLQLQFGDIDKEDKQIILFNNTLVMQIVDFVKNHENKIELIICQCEAGISRSAGIAAALSKYYNGDDDYFFKHHNPNRHVYRLLLNQLFKM